MKKLLTLFVAIALVATAALAVVAADKGPEVVELDAKMGKVTFQHYAHQERVADCATCHHKGVEAGACSSCHGANPEAPKAKTIYHKLCKDCHKQSGGNAPTKCKGCHVK